MELRPASEPPARKHALLCVQFPRSGNGVSSESEEMFSCYTLQCPVLSSSLLGMVHYCLWCHYYPIVCSATITPLSMVPLLPHCPWYHYYPIVCGTTITPSSMVSLILHCPWYPHYPIVHGSFLLQFLALLCSQYSVYCV